MLKTYSAIRRLAALLLAGAALVALAPPVRAEATGRVGNIAYRISKAPNAADANAIAFSASDMRYLVGGIATMTAMVHGPCANVMKAQLILQKNPRLSFERFLASRSSDDLPIQELLQVAARALAEYCGSTQVLRVAIQNVGYEGTLTRAGGWVLQDGYVPTEFDASARVDLRVEDATSTLHVLHRGTCEAEPRLLMERTRAPRLDLGDALLQDYASLAAKAAAAYAQQCRTTQRVYFAMGVMPERWLCAQPGDCFMEARSSGNDWLTDLEQLRRHTLGNPVANFMDMIEVLAAGRFDILRDYDSYVGHFASSFFEAYSEACRPHIREPVSRVLRTTRTKTVGGVVVSEETSETRPVYVEAEHAWIYDTASAKRRQYLFRRATSAGSAVPLGDLPGEVQTAKKLVDGRCTDELTLAVYQNLVNHAAGKPAVTGKFSTAKKPITHAAQQGGQSAPEFTSAYLRQRAERFAADRQPAPPGSTGASMAPAATAAASNATPEGHRVPPTPAPAQNTSDLLRQYTEAVATLEQDYRAQMQGAGAFQRIKLEAELKYKKLVLEREFRENLKRAPKS